MATISASLPGQKNQTGSWGNIQTREIRWEKAGEGSEVQKLTAVNALTALIAPTKGIRCKRGKVLEVNWRLVLLASDLEVAGDRQLRLQAKRKDSVTMFPGVSMSCYRYWEAQACQMK